jgi:Cdc6-like AAA superfamily ATPase
MAKASIDWNALESAIRKSFSPAAPIDQRQLFAGRNAQIKRLLDAISERGRHAVLYGERGVGKTSLTNIFHMLIEGTEQRVLPIRVQSAPQDDYVSLWRKVLREITYPVTENQGYGKETTVSRSFADPYTDKITADDVVRSLRSLGNSFSVVVIFDEFDKIDSIETKKMMSHTIKALSDSGASATIVIVGVADDINTLVEAHESVKRNLEEIKMPRMSNDEMKEILAKRIPLLGLTLHPDAQWKIITLSRGLPEYAHTLGRNAAVNAIEKKSLEIVEANVDQSIRNMLLQSDQSSNNAYKKAILSNKKTALYRQVLLACALAKTDDEGKFTLAAVIEPLSSVLGKRLEIAGFQFHVSAFCTTERGKLLEQHGHARTFKYRFREPKMQPYVLIQGIDSGDLKPDALATLSTPEQPALPFTS